MRRLGGHASPRESEPADPSQDKRRGQIGLALAIVTVSILAATMAWRASVADDAAGSAEQRAEQNLLAQQQLIASDETSVLHDITLFGSYAADQDYAHMLLRAAAHAPPAQARGLTIQAQQDLQIAGQEGALFEVIQPTTGHDGMASFAARYARRQARLDDPDLLSLQAPTQLRAQAAREETKGLRLTGLAVLFVAALVLFTFAQLSVASLSALFALSAGVVTLAALALFVAVG